MSAKSPEVLTPEEQRLLFTTIPDDLTTQEMARYYALSAEDIAFIRQHRGADNRLGVALQLCCLRFPGRMLMQMTSNFRTGCRLCCRTVASVCQLAFAQYGHAEGHPMIICKISASSMAIVLAIKAMSCHSSVIRCLLRWKTMKPCLW
jgi:hypothetical protein